MNMICKPKSHVTLSQCEAVVAEGLEALEKVRKALRIIDEQELYGEQFESFEAYCQSTWKLSQTEELCVSQNLLHFSSKNSKKIL